VSRRPPGTLAEQILEAFCLKQTQGDFLRLGRRRDCQTVLSPQRKRTKAFPDLARDDGVFAFVAEFQAALQFPAKTS